MLALFLCPLVRLDDLLFTQPKAPDGSFCQHEPSAAYAFQSFCLYIRQEPVPQFCCGLVPAVHEPLELFFIHVAADQHPVPEVFQSFFAHRLRAPSCRATISRIAAVSPQISMMSVLLNISFTASSSCCFLFMKLGISSGFSKCCTSRGFSSSIVCTFTFFFREERACSDSLRVVLLVF